MFGNESKVIAITDTFESQLAYYLATAFDNIKMEPIGNLPMSGMSTWQLFLREMFDKIGIEFRAHSVGPWKGVNSMVTEKDGWSQPQRENITTFMTNLHTQLKEDIVSARSNNVDFKESKDASTSLSIYDKVQNFMDLGLVTAKDSLASGLIDGIGYKWEYLPLSKEQKKTSTAPSSLHMIPIKKFIEAARAKHQKEMRLLEAAGVGLYTAAKGGPVNIGLVHLSGTIMRGDQRYGSNSVSEALIAAGRDPKVDAIVFRIDTGGGDAISSESIASAVDFVQTSLNKPVIASFGNVSASGGYYSSATCAKILCSPGTITGSIGVAAAVPMVTPGLFNKLGMKVADVQLARGGNLFSLVHEWDASQVKYFHQSLESIYDVFKQRVWRGRSAKLQTLEQMDKVVGGRIFSGREAIANGLVDEIGGLRDSVNAAVRMVKEKHGKDFSDSGNVDLNRDVKVHSFPPSKKLWETLVNGEAMVQVQLHLQRSIVGLVKGAAMKSVEEQVKVSASDPAMMKMNIEVGRQPGSSSNMWTF
ncbi:hypothetical protein HDV05_007700 [Chytridiales sp. JEL 0842]|nr:hypothetical protein HDV05_007700 [Chytridiales sp. JEL 0842]